MYIKSSYGTSKIYTVLFINCCYILIDLEVIAVQSLSCVWPFVTPWTAAPGYPVIHCLLEFAQTCPLSWWCNPTILSSVAPFSSCLQSFSETGSFLTSDSLHQVVKVLELQRQHQSFQWIFSWFPLGLTGLVSSQSTGLSRVFSSTTIQKHQFFSAQPSLESNSHIHTLILGKP